MSRAFFLLAVLLLAGMHVTTGRYLLEAAAAGTGICADGYHCCDRAKDGRCNKPCLKSGNACPQQGHPGHIHMRKLVEGESVEPKMIEGSADAQALDAPAVVEAAKMRDDAQAAEALDAPARVGAAKVVMARDSKPADKPKIFEAVQATGRHLLEFAAAGTGPCQDGYHCCSSVKNGHCSTGCQDNRYVCKPTGPTHPLY